MYRATSDFVQNRAMDPDQNVPMRAVIVGAFSEALSGLSDDAAGIGSVLRSTGYSDMQIKQAFGNTDELLVAMAEHEAALLSYPLIVASPKTVNDVCASLTAFGRLAWTQYSTTIAGFMRLISSEGVRQPSLMRRIREAGPDTVLRELCAFLSQADAGGVLAVANVRRCGEQLMGIFRVPLYEAMLRSPHQTHGCEAEGYVVQSVRRFVAGCSRMEP